MTRKSRKRSRVKCAKRKGDTFHINRETNVILLGGLSEKLETVFQVWCSTCGNGPVPFDADGEA